MKYHRLTQAQFENMHEEFSKYLAALSIDRSAWNHIKTNRIDEVDRHLDEFSDLVWEEVLSKDLYLEHLSPNHFFVFQCLATHMHLIAVKLETPAIDLSTQEGWEWLLHHIHDEKVTLYRSSKGYSHDRKEELYGMILKGATLSNEDRYKSIANFLL